MPDLYENDANDEYPEEAEAEADDHVPTETLNYKRLKRDRVLAHLQSGKSLIEKEALDLYDCASLSGAVHSLRNEGWPIASEQRRDDDGKRYSSYRMVHSPRQQDEPPLFAKQTSQALQASVVAPPSETKQPKRKAVDAESVTVRMGAGGPELQVLSSDDEETDIFYKLNPAQIEYLFVNLKIFMEMRAK